MKTWIKLAIENGGVMVIYKRGDGYCAKMSWMNGKIISLTKLETIDEALDALNEALQDDAAEEVKL